MLGYSAEEAEGASCATLLQGCDVYGNRYCSDDCPVIQMAVRTQAVRHFDLRLRTKEARTVRTDVSILHLAARPPESFFLAHILTPSERAETALQPTQQAAGAGPSPALVTVQGSPDARARRLTAREVEVLGMLAAGHTTPEIGSRLHISNLTARNHIQNLLEKLEVHSKAEAVAFAFQKRLL